VKDPKDFQNCHPFAFHKMTDPQEEPQEAASHAAADSQKGVDSLEEVDTQEEAECHPADHQEEDGDHHQSLCHKPNKEN